VITNHEIFFFYSVAFDDFLIEFTWKKYRISTSAFIDYWS